MALRIRQFGHGYAIYEGEQRITGECQSHGLAEARLLDIEHKRAMQARSKMRGCLCCGAKFLSTGPGHRMCAFCRGRHSGLPTQMVG